MACSLRAEIGMVRCWERRAGRGRTPTFVSERGDHRQGSHSEVRRRASGQVVAAAGAAGGVRLVRRGAGRDTARVSARQDHAGVPR